MIEQRAEKAHLFSALSSALSLVYMIKRRAENAHLLDISGVSLATKSQDFLQLLTRQLVAEAALSLLHR